MQLPSPKDLDEIYACGKRLIADGRVSELKLKLAAGLNDHDEEQVNNCYQPIVEYIKNSAYLSCVLIDGSYLEAPSFVISLILDAISKNSSITKLSLRLCKTDIQSFANLLCSGSIKHLEVTWCLWENKTNLRRTEYILAGCFRDNQTIETLRIEKIGYKYLVAVITSLVDHTKLSHLSVYYEGSITPTTPYKLGLSTAIQCLTSGSTRLKHLELNAFRLQTDVFEPIVNGLIKSKSVKELSVQSCTFFPKGSMSRNELVDTIVQPSENHSDDGRSTCHLLARLIQQSTSLNTLNFNGILFGMSPVDFTVILEAVANSDILHTFRYEFVRETRLCQALINSIPNMLHLREIQFELDSGMQALIPQLMDSLCRNGSLHRIDAKSEFFSAKQIKHLQNYCHRNAKVPRLLTCPAFNDGTSDEVPAAWLPRVIERALDSEVSSTLTIFQGLMLLSGHQWASGGDAINTKEEYSKLLDRKVALLESTKKSVTKKESNSTAFVSPMA